MVHTAIGIFPTLQKAQAAIDHLVQAGFKDEFIALTHREKIQPGSAMAYKNDHEYARELNEYFAKVFNSAEDVDRYTLVALQGVLVSVQGDNYGQAARAAEILDACGTLHVEDKAQSLKHGYNEHERLNDVNDHDDRNVIASMTSADRSDEQRTRPAEVTETVTFTRTFKVDSELDSDIEMDEHYKVRDRDGIVGRPDETRIEKK